MKLLYEVNAVACADDGSITLHETVALHPCQPVNDLLTEALRSHYTTVIRTRDEAVRQALIKLGWQPPAAD